jgi:hypothetical protein
MPQGRGRRPSVDDFDDLSANGFSGAAGIRWKPRVSPAFNVASLCRMMS